MFESLKLLFGIETKMTGKQRVYKILGDHEPHYGYDIIKHEKFHKFTSRVSDINKPFIDPDDKPIKIDSTNTKYKIYTLVR